MGGGALRSFVPAHHSLLPTAQPSFPLPPSPQPLAGEERGRGAPGTFQGGLPQIP